jgi:ligand-binding SRPBCC domain-containing protein
MKEFVFHKELWLPAPLETVFPFFAKPHNLQILTPPWLNFEILTPESIEMCVGTLIDYKLHIRGIPIRWQSEITVWEPPRRFVDEQRKGPYRQWIHEHRFEERDGGTLCTDHVRYAAPGGALVEKFFIRPDIEKIFAYRAEMLIRSFPE